MNREKYREILDTNLLQSVQDHRLGKRFTFQQDNNPKHTAKTMQEWLRDKSLKVLEWPSQSLDLNPIEHLRRPENSNAEKKFEKLPKYSCAKLVASYLRRLEPVIAAKGASTKY